MDLSAEELGGLGFSAVVGHSLALSRSSPRTFSLVTLTLILPLSSAALGHYLLTHPLLRQLHRSLTSSSTWSLLLLYQLLYLLFLLLFSLLSTAAVVFTVASLLSSRSSSFASTLRAIPPVFSRLVRTFALAAALVSAYHIALVLSLLILLSLLDPQSPAFPLLLIVILLPYLALHVYIAALWHLASVVTVLEPLAAFAAMQKSRDLLRGRLRLAASLVLAYLASCGVIGITFRLIVVKGGGRFSLATRIVVGMALIAAQVAVNYVGLLVQSVFYYVCKGFHHQAIDKGAMYEHLGGYLGEYVPLKSSIQMEDL